MSIGIWQLLIVLVIVLVLFGAKRLRNVGTDLGEAVKGFRSSMKDAETDAAKINKEKLEQHDGEIIEGEVTSKEKTSKH